MIFLDTHALIWIFQGDKERFSPVGLGMLEQEELSVSPMVFLELEYLYETGRILMESRVIREELTGKSICRVDDLSQDLLTTRAAGFKWTRDPFDRLITAHAALRGAPLLTKDTGITRNYPRAVW